MAKRTPQAARRATRPQPPVATEPLEVVDPTWVFKALAVCLVAAALCGYGAVCLLLYQGSWQLLLHPSHVVEKTPASVGLAFDPLRFDAAATGTPRLAGWWIAAGRQNAPTILVLHDGHGSLSSTVDLLGPMHQAGANVFAFDYRGFGTSDPEHPTEQRMNDDAEAAYDYLVNTRHIPPATIIPYGAGLGASLAARLAVRHAELAALVIDNPDPDAGQRLIASENTRFLPTEWLLHDRFELRTVLTRVKLPEMLVTGGPEDTAPARDEANLKFFRAQPGRKLIVALNTAAAPGSESGSAADNLTAALRRFLDEAVPASVTGEPLLTLPAPDVSARRSKQ